MRAAQRRRDGRSAQKRSRWRNGRHRGTTQYRRVTTITDTPHWRHYRITEVRNEPEGNYSIVDEQDCGRLWIDGAYGVTPRAGDSISYYGHFGDSPTTLGWTLEAVVIGERMVWDERGE